MNITQCFTRDHERLDALFERTLAAFHVGERVFAREQFGEFQAGLDRHIDVEETMLFPIFEAHAPPSGPTHVMRVEHVEIRKAMHDIASALAAGDEQRLRQAADALRSVLTEHNMKEEHVLYPAIDQMATDEERASIVVRMEGSS